MADIASSIDIRDPLGQPPSMDRSGYLDALARLGYNVENMNSNLPFATANMNAASNLITSAYKQQMDFQKAQADIQYITATAKHLDSETAFNTAALNYKIRALDLDDQIKADNARLSHETLEGAIRAQQFKDQMTPQVESAKLAQEELNRQDAQARLAETNIGLGIAKKAQDEQGKALAEFPIPEDPDYFQKIADNIAKYPNAWGNERTRGVLLSEEQARTNSRNNNKVVLQRNADAVALQKAVDAHYLGAGTQVDQLSRDHQSTTAALRGANIHQNLDRVQTLIARMHGIAPPELHDQVAALEGFANQMRGILQNPEQGMQDIMMGVHAGLLDADGNLSPVLDGDIKALEDYYAAYVKRAEAVPSATEVTTKPDITGKPVTEIKQTKVPPGKEQEEAARQRALLGEPTPTPTPTAEQAQATQKAQASLSAFLQNWVTQNPQFRPMLEQAQKSGNYLPLYQALGIESKQSGGLVGVRPGLAKQTGGIIFNPASVGAASTDTVPAMLTPGEYVVNRSAVQAVGQGTLDAINQAGQREMQIQSTPQFRGMPQTPQIGRPLGQPAVQPVSQQQQTTAQRPTTQPGTTAATPQVSPWWGGSNVKPWYGQPTTQPATTQSSTSPAGTTAPATTPTATTAVPETLGTFTNPATGSVESLGTGWVKGIGTEFGEVDNPIYGGYTEANWDKGAGGAKLSGWDTEGVALPGVPIGTVVQVMNPKTGQVTTTTVKDHGPGPGTGAAIDLLGGTRAALGLPRNFKGDIQYRIVSSPGTQVAGMQRGGLVSEEGSIGTPGARGRSRGGVFGGGRTAGIEGSLDAPVDPRMRHRRFHPRVGAAGGLGAIAPDIPDPMQKKLAKLSQGYLSGLSDLIRQSPEMGPALLHHARHQLAANMGGQAEDWMGGAGSEMQGEQMQRGMGGMGGMGVPPEMYAGSRAAAYGAEGGGEESQYMQYGGAVTGTPEDLMNAAMLDPESMGINFQRGGAVPNPLTALAQSQSQLTNLLSMLMAQ